MKINIEDYLHKIDSSFKDKTQRDIYMIYIMIFAAIFAFSYLLFWETSENDFIKKNDQISDIRTKINNDQIFLKINPSVKIDMLEQDIKKAELDLVVIKDNNGYIKNKLEDISSLIYDERAWGEYLDSISKNAQIYNVKILEFTNEYGQTNKSFGHVLDIKLKTTANYKNTLKFINSLEQSELVVDIHDLHIYKDEDMYSDINISVWGISY